MKLLRNLLVIIGIIVAVLIVARWYLGGFTTPAVTEKAMAPYVIAYTTFTWEYKDVGPTMTKLYDALSGAGVTSSTGVGIYYDDPDAISGKSLRSDVGSVISQSDFAKLNKKSADYKLKVVEGWNMVVVEFPYKNSFSYMVGPIRVYPVVNAYLKEKGYNTGVARTELYDVTAKKIYYIAEIVK